MVKQSYGFINHPKDLPLLKEELRKADVIAVDTEFIRETTFFPQVALIQIATATQTWLLDPTTLGAEHLKPVLQLMNQPEKLKVMHAAHADQECFHTAYQMVLHPVLDTAVAAALLGMGDNIGLGRITKEILGVTLPKGRARTQWLKRPLSQDLLDYAANDVAHLVALGNLLREKLTEKKRWEWAIEESEISQSLFETTPEEFAMRLLRGNYLEANAYPVLLELVRWREERARSANIPRNWLADNDTLLSLARSRPKTIEDLRAFRGS